MYKLNTIRTLCLIGLTCLWAITACNVNDNNKQRQNQGHITVQLTDAPAAFDAVNIDIEQVQIKENANESDTNDKGWVTISNDAEQVNLLDLRNGNTIQLGDKDLDAGTYQQIRLILGTNNNVVIGGETMPLKTPSAQQSGLKLNINAEVKEGETYNLLIDFDASRSVVQTGSGKFILKPVLHAVKLEDTGSISGTVQPGDVQTTVLAIANHDTLSTLTGDSGDFQIQGLSDGTFKVVFEPSENTFADTTLSSISIQNHNDVDLGTIDLPSR